MLLIVCPGWFDPCSREVKYIWRTSLSLVRADTMHCLDTTIVNKYIYIHIWYIYAFSLFHTYTCVSFAGLSWSLVQTIFSLLFRSVVSLVAESMHQEIRIDDHGSYNKKNASMYCLFFHYMLLDKFIRSEYVIVLILCDTSHREHRLCSLYPLASLFEW